MTSNRKNVVKNNKVEAVQSSWFTVPFVRGITEKLSRLNSERIRSVHRSIVINSRIH